MYLPRYGVWAVAGYREVHAALRGHERFSSAAGVGLANLATNPYRWRQPSLLIETDPPPHTRYRALVVGTMTSRALRDFRDLFESEAARLVATLVRRQRFDAVTDLAEIFPTLVSRAPWASRGPVAAVGRGRHHGERAVVRGTELRAPP